MSRDSLFTPYEGEKVSEQVVLGENIEKIVEGWEIANEKDDIIIAVVKRQKNGSNRRFEQWAYLEIPTHLAPRPRSVARKGRLIGVEPVVTEATAADAELEEKIFLQVFRLRSTIIII
jgi:hypothetical protein